MVIFWRGKSWRVAALFQQSRHAHARKRELCAAQTIGNPQMIHFSIWVCDRKVTHQETPEGVS